MPFLGGNRPRVPSNDALKVLYQLAYISSGTAVGFGVLCAEERRRRAKLVQRIADNAKRIRQSPRYIHNAAVAVREAEEWAWSGGYEAASPLEAQEGNHCRNKRRKTKTLRDERTSRGAELPTAVEDGYDQLQALQAQQAGDRNATPRRRRRSGAHTAGDPQPPNASSLSTTSSQHQGLAAGQHEVSRSDGSHQQTRTHGIPGSSAAARSSLPASSPRIAAAKFAESSNLTSNFRGRWVREGAATGANRSGSAPASAYQGRSAAANVVSSELTTREAPLRTEASKWLRLTEMSPAKSEWSRRSTPRRTQFVRRAEPAAVEQQQPTEGLRDELQDCTPSEALSILRRRSRSLAKDRVAHALVFELLDRTVADDDISTATAILILLDRWNARFSRHDLERCEKLLSLLDAHQAYEATCKLFGPHGVAQRIEIEALREEATEIIAFACTQLWEPGPKHALFKSALRQVPQKSRGRIMDSCSILTLTSIWKTTRNLRLVEERAQLMRNFAARVHHVNLDRRELDETLLDILIDSGDHDAANAHLAKMRERYPDDLLMAMGAGLVLAKRGDWPALDSSMESSAHSRRIGFEAAATKRFNAIVRLHGESHSPTETWSFVTKALENLSLHPNQPTTEIMLEMFVKHKAPQYIPLWITYMRRLGQRVALNSTLATELLTEYYVKYRPNHMIVMWLCRNVPSRAPSLAGPEYSELVKRAIAFDLRTITGQNRAWRRENAAQRLDMVERNEGDVIPAPGAVYDTKLYLRQPHRTNDKGSNVQDFTPMSSASVEPSSHITQPPTPADVDALYWDADLQALTEEEMEAGYQVPDRLSPSPEPAASASIKSVKSGQSLRARSWRAPSAAESDMLVASARRDHQKVLALYHDSRDAVGLPASVLALEIAVRSALHLENGLAIAHAIIEQAKRAGCDTSWALGALLLHRIRQVLARSDHDMPSLTRVVLEYYRLSQESGRAVGHSLAIHAARSMIDVGRARAGVDLLRALRDSQSMRKVPLDIVAMTTFLYGYGALKDHEGIEWVFGEVLRRDVRISAKFLQVAGNISRKMYGTRSGRIGDPIEEVRGKRMKDFIRLCKERKVTQAHEATVQGRRLVNALVKTAKMLEMPTVSLTERRAIEAKEFGEPVPASLIRPADCGNMNPVYAARRHLRRARNRLPERPLNSKRVAPEWTRKYRKFLRQNLVAEDGRLASFRYRLSDNGEAGVAENQRRRARRILVDSKTGSDAAKSVTSS